MLTCYNNRRCVTAADGKWILAQYLQNGNNKPGLPEDCLASVVQERASTTSSLFCYSAATDELSAWCLAVKNKWNRHREMSDIYFEVYLIL